MPASTSTKRSKKTNKTNHKPAKDIYVGPASEDNLSLQYGGTVRAPPELGLSQADGESNGGEKLLGAELARDSVDLSELEQSASKVPSSRTKGNDGDALYGLLPDNSMEYVEGFTKQKTGKEALHDMFLLEAAPVATKNKQDKLGTKVGLGGKRLTKAQEEEWQQKLVKLPGVIGEDNVERLKKQKEELDDLRGEIEYLEKQKALY